MTLDGKVAVVTGSNPGTGLGTVDRIGAIGPPVDGGWAAL